MAVFCMLLFLALLLNATYVQYVRADDLNSRDGNRRVIDAEFSRERGPVLVAGEPVAASRPVDDRYQFQRRYAQPFKYAHLTGYFSYIYGASAVEASQSEKIGRASCRERV